MIDEELIKMTSEELISLIEKRFSDMWLFLNIKQPLEKEKDELEDDS
jgi:hypothetical protein